MKKTRSIASRAVALLSIPALVLAFAAAAGAAPVIKEATGTDLNDGASWVGGAAPTSADVATWMYDGITNSLNAGLTLGANTNWLGIDVQGAVGNIDISGAGILTLGSSGITIADTAGVDLTLVNPCTFGDTSSLSIGSGRTLNVNTGTTTFGAGTTTSITGGGKLAYGGSNHAITGAGALIIGSGSILANNLQSGSTSTNYSGTTTLNGGTISISTSISCFGTGTINLNGGTFGSFSSTGRTIGNNAINIGGDLQFGGAVSGLLGTGYLYFSGPVDLGGVTRTFDLYTSGSLGTRFSGQVSNGAITVNSTPSNGILTLDNDGNTYTGATTVNAGRLATSLNALASSASVTLGANAWLFIGINGLTTINNLNGGATSAIRTDFTISGTSAARNLLVNQTTDGEFAGTFTQGSSRTISLAKAGNATLTLSGAATYTGATTVSNGTLRVTGSTSASSAVTVAGGTLDGSGIIGGTVTVNSGGTLAAGTATIGTLTINNTVTLQSGSTNVMRINKSGVTLTADQIAGTGNLALDGTLVVTASGDPLAHNDSFTLFAKGSYSNSFAATSLPALTGSLAWDLSNLTNNGIIRVYNTNQVATPVFSPVAGGYASPQSVAISSAVGATIYYTTDGWVTTNTYTAPIALPADTTSFTINAYATLAGFTDSSVGSATYSTTPVPTWLQVAGGSWTNAADWSNNVPANAKGVTADFSTLTLTADATVTLDGPKTVGNLLFADQANSYNWTLNPGSSGPLTLDSASGASTLAVSNMTTTIGATIAGTNSLTKTGVGTLVVTAANTYSGGTTVSDGTLQLGTGANNTASLGAGDVTIGPSASLSVAWNSGVIVLGNNLAGSGTFIRGGTSELALTGTNTFSGTYQITNNTLAFRGLSSANGQPKVLVDAAGNLALGNDFAGQTCTISELSGSGGVNPQFDNAAGTKTLNINQTIATTFSGVMRDATTGSRYLAVTKSGSGTLTLSGANTYTRPTTVDGGVLEIASSGSLGASPVTVNSNATLAASGTLGGSVTVQAGGTLVPATVTTNLPLGTPVTVSGSLTLNGGVIFRISKDGGFAAHDQILASAGVNYGGALVVTNVTADATPLAAGDVFFLFSGSPLSGNFTTVDLPALPGGLNWDLSGLPSGSISVVSGTPTAIAPSFSPLAGGYVGAQTITIASINPGATTTVHYSLDNINWSSNLSPASVVVPVNTNVTIYAFASAPGYNQSTTASAAYATLDKATWVAPNDGSWASDFNWSNNVIPNVSGALADFSTLTLPTTNITVTLDGPKTVGQLRFADLGNTYGWNIISGTGGPFTLTLDNGTNAAAIDVANQSAAIYPVLAGTNNLVKTGAGVLQLGATPIAANLFTGDLIVSNGTLSTLSQASASGWSAFGSLTNSRNITVNSGATLAMGINNVFINSGPIPTAMLVINAGGKVTTSRYNGLGPVTLNGGTLENTIPPGTDLNYDGYAFKADDVIVGGTSASTISSTTERAVRLGTNTTFLVADATSDSNADLVVSCPLADQPNTLGIGNLLKAGVGTMTLLATNTYIGTTTVSNGTLLVNGSLAAGSVVTVAGGALGGTGTIGGAVTVNSGATLAPGASIGTLAVNGALALNAGSTSTFEVDGSTPTNDAVVLGGSVAYGGTLNIVPSGTFTPGQTFTLFSGAGATNAGNFASLTGSPGGSLSFSFTNGVLSVVGTGVTPVTLTNTVSGSTLELSWPAGQGWRLEWQTNVLGKGLSTNWLPLTDGSISSTNIPMDKHAPTVFYRLVNP